MSYTSYLVILLNDKVLSILGIAKSAGKIVAGSDTVERLLKQNKLHYVFIANDASVRTIDRFVKKCFHHKTSVNTDYSCDELSKSIGKPMVKILGLIDAGFASSLKKHLNGGVMNESK